MDSFYIAAAAAKSLQSCPTLCDPIDGSPPGSPVPGILQARTPEWVAISFSNAWKWKVKVKLLSHVRLLVTPWTATHQTPPSMGFSRQEYWSELPLPSSLMHAKVPEILPIVASEPSVQTSTQWKDKSHLVLLWKQFWFRGLLKVVLGPPKGLKTILCKWQLQITYWRPVSVNWFLSLPAWGKKYQSSVKSSIMELNRATRKLCPKE